MAYVRALVRMAAAPRQPSSDAPTQATPLRALIRPLEENGLLVLLFGAAAMVLCVAVAPFLLGADFWLSLVAGREISESGLPQRDALTVLAAGREWIDQQWLAHLILYSLVRLGGLPLVTLVGVGSVLGAFVLAAVAARVRGASQPATVIVAFVALLAAPWAFALRAQALALPLFVAVAWLLVDARDEIRRRTFLIVPLMIVWANVHGSVVLGALLVVVLALSHLVRRGLKAAPWAALLALSACAAMFVTPYDPAAIVRYYDRTLIDPPFADLVVEWRRPDLNLLTAGFFLLAAATIVLAVWQWRRLGTFEVAALVATLAGALMTLRGVVWFVLLAAICLPAALDGATRLRDSPGNRGFNRALVAVVAAACLGFAASIPFRGSAWLESRMPSALLSPLDRATRTNGSVWGTGPHRRLAPVAPSRPTREDRLRRPFRASDASSSRSTRALRRRSGTAMEVSGRRVWRGRYRHHGPAVPSRRLRRRGGKPCGLSGRASGARRSFTRVIRPLTSPEATQV